MQVYKGILTTKWGSYEAIITNDFKQFYLQVGKVLFEGSDFGSLELKSHNIYNSSDLNIFDLEVYKNGQQEYLELVNYILRFELPLNLIDTKLKEEFSVEAKCFYTQREGVDRTQISFSIHDELFEAAGDFLELVFDELQHAFKGRYRFKNCYGCLFADYSVYGQGVIGPMLCFKNQKQAYLKIVTKQEYLNLDEPDALQQELYCCEDFQSRDIVVGYRGTVK
ncbi:DUF6304 family protein [Myroides sp. LJL116]